jgi:succinyl-diaminopimelate desuccinylase
MLATSAFQRLVARYREETGATVKFTTRTIFGPDIRNPKSRELSAVNNAYKDVLGEDCPMRAVGGGTDAHGNLSLVAAGALFTGSFGPPINFHGLNEGAPIEDLIKGKKILTALLLDEAGRKETGDGEPQLHQS